ncbi:MAG: serine acetyltransferase [Thermodesulfobacteriota bacterium]|nr:serine acetyltransferase [Thermodesulfobacteriota bacterium]
MQQPLKTKKETAYGFFKTIRADAFRYKGRQKFPVLATYVRVIEYRYIFWMRLTAFLRQKKALRPFHYISRILLHRIGTRLGISIPYNTTIMPGFYIGHFGGIVVHPEVRIGWNCNISNRVTIGIQSRGEKAGVPKIGDNVYIGPGAVVIGAITIGSNVAIGANCVVTKDIPDHGVVVGIPGQIISYKGTEGYISNTDYDTRH